MTGKVLGRRIGAVRSEKSAGKGDRRLAMHGDRRPAMVARTTV